MTREMLEVQRPRTGVGVCGSSHTPCQRFNFPSWVAARVSKDSGKGRLKAPNSIEEDIFGTIRRFASVQPVEFVLVAVGSHEAWEERGEKESMADGPLT